MTYTKAVGKYNEAKVFTKNIEETARQQIQDLLDNEISKGSKIRFMPDIHAGAGCTIGTTMTITDKVCPFFVGVDIGCGLIVQKLAEQEIDLKRLDEVIRKNIPTGFSNRRSEHRFADQIDLTQLRCYNALKNHRNFSLAIGTLGGGNHFIEVNKDKDRNLYMVIHSGSRNLGNQVAQYYQNAAFKQMKELSAIDKAAITKKLVEAGRDQEIEQVLGKNKSPRIDKQSAYCVGELMDDYLHDMHIIQDYAVLNRKAMADTIQTGMRYEVVEEFQTIHNYIELDTMILRKGAVSAKKGEKLIIPINMRDGSLICIGKGNEDWNYSAPHGAGRTMSRTEARKILSLDKFKNSMKHIYTTCVSRKTIDESPMAYKPMQEIIDNIGDTVDIIAHIKPIYNHKAD
ncbi:MAG: RtcB family protein [Candidatus Cloacimonadaceae bacterium]|jgi:RNA-splicing ligase RtcB|nr:RtcB family protein [Candidatus Cloacimonadota bacterium]MDY0128449.1 RtcB family protein [Candidatus Cloacimonadaceae bacterium]MCB5254842.1 RtcB family protein [Candidatus Cloacimonadota bacterium]MCK9179047.1 RtcB family protein [Candidatus Cloacimonadota bacterium]MCK9241973.1 RtcB family protein [Candidatus Cloacimonadota bacterium]